MTEERWEACVKTNHDHAKAQSRKGSGSPANEEEPRMNADEREFGNPSATDICVPSRSFAAAAGRIQPRINTDGHRYGKVVLESSV